jgi:hypothetical protein
MSFASYKIKNFSFESQPLRSWLTAANLMGQVFGEIDEKKIAELCQTYRIDHLIPAATYEGPTGYFTNDDPSDYSQIEHYMEIIGCGKASWGHHVYR